MANNTAGSLPIFLPWAGKRVRIGEVDSTLSSLWKMSADNMRIGANLNVRTSVMNLVICTSDIETANYANQLLRDLASVHLARATIVILDNSEGAPDMMDSWVTLRCFSMISDLMRYCFEQTTLLVSGKATRALRNTLPTILKAHLPTYLWWIGDTRDPDDAVFRAIADMCQRVVVDSTTFFSPEQNVHTLAEYCKNTPEVALSDLSWGRLISWQQLIAQFFDVPEYLPFLSGVEKIEIEHAVAPLAERRKGEGGEVSPNPTSALLLGGWLKARLNLAQVAGSEQSQRDTLSGTYQWLLQFPTGSASTLMQIRPYVLSALRPGSLYLIRLTCQFQGRRAVFTIQRDTDLDYVLTSVELADDTRPTRTVNLPARYNESDLLRNELEIMVHDESFEQALQEIAGLLTG